MAELPEWVREIRMDAIADPSDKIAECEYFLGLASNEPNRERFRWLISAFLGAAYSYFEIRGLRAYRGRPHPETGEPVEDEDELRVLRQYVRVSQDKRNPDFVKTSGLNDITGELYKFRKQNTHHYPISLIQIGDDRPEGYHFGYRERDATPVLAFCRAAMKLIRQVEAELQGA